MKTNYFMKYLIFKCYWATKLRIFFIKIVCALTIIYPKNINNEIIKQYNLFLNM